MNNGREEGVRDIAHRIELAQADQNRAFVQALARYRPGSGASSLPVNGGWSNFAGANSPLSQAQALGFESPLDETDLGAIERHLGQGGGEIRIELTPFAAPSVATLLGARGYAVQEFHQVFAMSLGAKSGKPYEPTPPGVVIRAVRPDDDAAWSRAVVQGFMGTDAVGDEMADMLIPTLRTEGTTCLIAVVGDEAVGGGSIGMFDGVATLSGTGVRVGFRGRGVQTALIRARLEVARQHGCDLASSSTEPGTTSQRNLERCGFRVAYPKVVMRKAGSPS